MLDISKEQRGNLTQLKKEKILTTAKDEGCEFVYFSLNTGESMDVTDGQRTLRLSSKGEYYYPEISITPVG